MNTPPPPPPPPFGDFEVRLPQPDGTYVILPRSCDHYRIVERSADLALCLLETPEGQRSLRAVAREVIAGLKEQEAMNNKMNKGKDDKKKKKKDDGKNKGIETADSLLIYQYGDENLRFWIGHFLGRLRANFPPVTLSDAVEGEAEVLKADWSATQGKNVAHYHGRYAGRLYVSSVLIDNMVNARQQQSREAYKIFMFQMGISIAHEIVHLLTGFLVGKPRPNTPPHITLPGCQDPNAPDTGEAGRYWEGKLLGGVLECYEWKKDPLGLRQAGTPYLFEHAGRGATGHAISMAYIEATIDRKFAFPIRTEGPEIRRSKVRSATRETAELRAKCLQRDLVRPSTSTTGSGGDMRFRHYVPQVVAEGSSQYSYRKY